MIGALPTFHPSMNWPEVSAYEMNNLVAEVRRLRTIVGGPGVNVNMTPQGTSITTTTKPPVNVPRELVVALVEEPKGESQTLRVRQVRYGSMPPVAGEYEWDADYFDAYPAHGFEPLDYALYLCDHTSDAPQPDKVFLRAERRQNVWILRPPPSMAIANVVIIRGIPEGGENETTLRVQRITFTDDNTWAATGDTFDMPTFPLMPAIYWQRFVVPEGSVPEFGGDIQPTRTISGVECVELFVPLYAVEARSDDPYRGPRPV